ncbi:MAG: tRNA uridine-5-carboxymethylaminomethyl(34) synthesis GTPase MnmE [Micavibrio sp.]|nr:tRNA uridine-5-carboxymethylaminomethyl(34) synthesis GTPase MnmE [Micavibrio sp.]|tara:strand:- start:1121 stop:2473 length:1353 start_codon:yes stop_codon:yes gene_type:complete
MQKTAQTPTIFALASAHGRAGVSVVRVSGPSSWDSLKVMAAGEYKPRTASLRRLIHPDSRETLDEALVLPFKGPHSYTGEDTVEYHLHGGRAVVDSVLGFLASQPSHRMAEPGEFTRRAFENGKMDLTEAEAVADLIDAETSAQKAQALQQMGGALAKLYDGWSERLKKILAHMEADIEFPDEDLPEGIAPDLLKDIEDLLDDISLHLNDNRRGERLRDGIHIAIVGAPNAGKSSLVNALAQRDVAIISDLAGTTRDVIEVHLDIGGYPVIMADTAGLRPDQIGQSGQERIESEGIRRALKRAEEADIVVLLFDGSANDIDAHTLNLIDERSLLVMNKVDISSDSDGSIIDGALLISAKNGQGLDKFLETLLEKIKMMMISREMPSLTRKRHRLYIEEVYEALERISQAELPELIAEDVRMAIRALGRITGRVDVEDLLDVIFRDFCIGK